MVSGQWSEGMGEGRCDKGLRGVGVVRGRGDGGTTFGYGLVWFFFSGGTNGSGGEGLKNGVGYCCVVGMGSVSLGLDLGWTGGDTVESRFGIFGLLFWLFCHCIPCCDISLAC